MSNTSVSNQMVDGLAYCEQIYWEQGNIPTAEKLAEVVGVQVQTARNWFTDDRFREALLKRGVNLKAFEEGSNVLTFEQLNVANMYFNLHDKRSIREKLEELGVTSQQFHAWMRDPKFSSYLTKRAEKMFAGADAAAYRSIISAVENGDMNATKLMLEIKGIYSPKLDVNVNLDMIVVRFVEIVQKHVKDPATLAAIASDIEAIEGIGNSRAELPPVIETTAAEVAAAKDEHAPGFQV